MFNSLKYAKKLEEVGFTREQAETHVMIMTEVMESTFATQNDMKDVRQEFQNVRQEMKDLGTMMVSEFRRRDLEFQAEILKLENRLLVKLGGLIAFATTFLAFLKMWS